MTDDARHKKKVVMFTFSMKTQKITNSDKTKFYKELYGWTQTVPGGKKKYVYRREGIIEDVPHENIGQSSFLVPENQSEKMMQFFDEWRKKVMFRTFRVLDDQDFFKDFKPLRHKKMKTLLFFINSSFGHLVKLQLYKWSYDHH